MLKTLISQLGKEFEMTAVITEKNGDHFPLPFDNGIVVEASDMKHSNLLKGVIGKRPEKDSEAFLIKIMEANLFGIGNRGGVIGLKEDGKQLTLSFELDRNIPYKDFKEKLEDFISVMSFWQNESLKHE